ncbi:MAG: DsrE family protein [Chloroflexi bacterium]|nr:DsrE family protein [Chloroflexota bacterium]
MSEKTLVIFLATTPYGHENADTALRLAEAALAKGHRVRLFASGDGVHLAQLGQRPAGLPDALANLARLMGQGLQVELCGSCLRFRGLGRELLVEGAEPSSLKGLFAAVAGADAFVTLGG